jgi:hypothetical protein
MQSRNFHHSGAQDIGMSEGSSTVSAQKVERAVQPAGCSTTARAQEDEPVIWEAPTVLHREVRGRGERGEPEFAYEAVRGVGGPNKSVDPGEREAPGPRRAKAARADVSLRRAT